MLRNLAGELGNREGGVRGGFGAVGKGAVSIFSEIPVCLRNFLGVWSGALFSMGCINLLFYFTALDQIVPWDCFGFRTHLMRVSNS